MAGVVSRDLLSIPFQVRLEYKAWGDWGEGNVEHAAPSISFLESLCGPCYLL